MISDVTIQKKTKKNNKQRISILVKIQGKNILRINLRLFSLFFE
ncbi:hypothetical protein Cs308_0119 [Candidatus Chlamydia sanziniae]|uniref:Uncharacterized protein n=1 Tax=Candidatus Chlamydia sanziniae TaxID=1806891 RepID=A0A1A9HTG9_9CHLA|nr:hypothetical protein Cs308_0119 [Candidatus Chlamydia sanziniae]